MPASTPAAIPSPSHPGGALSEIPFTPQWWGAQAGQAAEGWFTEHRGTQYDEPPPVVEPLIEPVIEAGERVAVIAVVATAATVAVVGVVAVGLLIWRYS